MSNSAKHTPGPWFVPVGDEFRVRAHTRSGLNVSVVLCRNDEGGEEEGAANARLIAAAPELLEVCQMMLRELLEEAEHCGRLPLDLERAMALLQHVVTKAAGETK